jgi:hypothetical protein
MVRWRNVLASPLGHFLAAKKSSRFGGSIAPGATITAEMAIK